MNHITVSAGKFEADGTKNYKFIGEPHTSWDAAVNEVFTLELYQYPFCEIEFEVHDFRHVVDWFEFQRPSNFRK